MIPILDLLNFELGIKTKFCCFGHEDKAHLYIMFDDNVDFETGLELANKVTRQVNAHRLTFKYWVRYAHKPYVNWMCETNGKKTAKERLLILEDMMYALSK